MEVSNGIYNKWKYISDISSLPYISITESRDVSKILLFFSKNECRLLYVLDEGTLFGIITYGNIKRYIKNNLNDYITCDYFYLTEADPDRAHELRNNHTYLDEIPILVKDKFKGVLWFTETAHKISVWEKYELENHVIDKYVLNGKYQIEYDKWKLEKFNDVFQRFRDCHIVCYCYQPENLDVMNHITSEHKARLKENLVNYNRMLDVIDSFSEYELKTFFGNSYSPDVPKVLRGNIDRINVNEHNGIYYIDDLCCDFFNIKDGYRIVPNAEINNSGTIYTIGACGIFGLFSRDTETIQYYLQEKINSNKHSDDWKVVNAGLFYGMGNHTLSLLNKIHPKRDDIILIYCLMNEYDWFKKHYDNFEFWDFSQDGVFDIDDLDCCILDDWSHHNYIINERVADRIYIELEKLLNKIGDKSDNNQVEYTDPIYIDWNIHRYYKLWSFYNSINIKDGIIGAVVMNCNPFTKGHRYLIEQCLNIVSFLYILVVEENKSKFQFEDRIQMVKEGTADISDKVHVIPSGDYCISQNTFPDYFNKDSINQDVDMEYDLHVFGEVIAKELHVEYRFVGEEPFDMVTRQYNEAMKHILPCYGIKVVEIKRCLMESGKPVSASIARKYIEQGKELDELLPDSTIKYIKSML